MSEGVFFVGVSVDGRLWVWLSTDPRRPSGTTAAAGRRTQLGRERQWKTALLTFRGLYALATDGTLWRWDVRWPRRGFADSIVRGEPHQLGRRSDWCALGEGLWGGGVLALAADGGIWLWDEEAINPWLARSRRPRLVTRVGTGTNQSEP